MYSIKDQSKPSPLKDVKRQWTKIDSFKYQLNINGSVAGEINLAVEKKPMERTASFTLMDETYSIRNTGPWENAFIVYNQNNDIVLYSVHNNWYNKSFSLNYNNSAFQIIYQNIPIPGWYLIKNHKRILSYSFGKGKDDIVISYHTTDVKIDLLLEFIMIYLLHSNA